MAALKTETITIRVQPDIKAALRQAAAREYRSLANMLEVMVRNHCREIGVGVAPRSGAGGDSRTRPMTCSHR